MLLALGIVIYLAAITAALHFFGCVADEQAEERRRLDAWSRRLTAEATRQPYDQEGDEKPIVQERCPHCQSPARIRNGIPYKCQWCQKVTVMGVNPKYLKATP